MYAAALRSGPGAGHHQLGSQRLAFIFKKAAVELFLRMLPYQHLFGSDVVRIISLSRIGSFIQILLFSAIKATDTFFVEIYV